MAKRGNDRQYQITGTDYVSPQTKGRLFDSRAPDCCRETRAIPCQSSSINSFLLFPCPAHVSSQKCLAMTSKLVFGYDRLSGNRPFPLLCLNRCSNSAEREGGRKGWCRVLESELKAEIITSAAGRACPLLVWMQKHHRIMLAHSSERLSFRHNRAHFSGNLPHVSRVSLYTAVLIYCCCWNNVTQMTRLLEHTLEAKEPDSNVVIDCA